MSLRPPEVSSATCVRVRKMREPPRGADTRVCCAETHLGVVAGRAQRVESACVAYCEPGREESRPCRHECPRHGTAQRLRSDARPPLALGSLARACPGDGGGRSALLPALLFCAPAGFG